MTYLETATQIIKDSIKSAIFIDENAREVFAEINEKPEYEEKLSLELYNNFKNQGISLTIQKFENGQEEDKDILEYLFGGRDLVLLDWKLDGKYGEERSLKLLSEIIKNLTNNLKLGKLFSITPTVTFRPESHTCPR